MFCVLFCMFVMVHNMFKKQTVVKRILIIKQSCNNCHAVLSSI